MKWNKRGQEFITEWKNREIQTIYIYGAGDFGKQIYKDISFLDCKKVFMDRDESKQKDGCLGEKVIDPKDILQNHIPLDKAIIIVALSLDALTEVSNNLRRSGYKENKEYFLFDNFKNYLSIISAYCFDKVYIKASTIFISTKCNLKCQNCSFAIPYLENQQEFDMDEVIKDVNLFFEKVDFVSVFYITGGEPLLCNTEKLIKIINHIGLHYRKNINIFLFLTNGTILLPNQLLKSFKENDITVQISDYTLVNPQLNTILSKNKLLLKNSKVKYLVSKEQKWIDFGFIDNEEKKWTEEKLIDYFDKCNTGCRGFRNGKFYYCYNSEMTNEILEYYDDNMNSFDFTLRKKDQEFIKELAEFDVGYNVNGYINMCKRCNGYFTINKSFIPAGVQLK